MQHMVIFIMKQGGQCYDEEATVLIKKPFVYEKRVFLLHAAEGEDLPLT